MLTDEELIDKLQPVCDFNCQYLRKDRGERFVVTNWHQGQVTAWQCVIPVGRTLFNEIRDSPYPLEDDVIDSKLGYSLGERNYQRRPLGLEWPNETLEWQGLDHYRTTWDNYFADLTGLSSRRSSAQTILEGEEEEAEALEDHISQPVHDQVNEILRTPDPNFRAYLLSWLTTFPGRPIPTEQYRTKVRIIRENLPTSLDSLPPQESEA